MDKLIYIKYMLKLKRTYIVSIALLLYPLNMFFNPSAIYKTSVNFGENYSYMIYFNILSTYTVTFLILPLFMLILEYNSIIFDNYNLILKMKNKKKWWNERIKCISLDCLLFTIFINFIVYISISLSGNLKEVDIEFVAMTFVSSLQQFLGYLVFGWLFAVMCHLSSRRLLGFISAFAVIAIDFVFFQIGVPMSILVGHMLNYGIMRNILCTSVLYSLIYLVSIILLLYLICINAVSKKESVGGGAVNFQQ